MADNYTEHRLAISFKAKFLVAEAIRRTVVEEKSVNFEWGQISKMAKHTEGILELATSQARDVRLDKRE